MTLSFVLAGACLLGSILFSVGEGALLDFSWARLAERADSDEKRESINRRLEDDDAIAAGTITADTLSNIGLVIFCTLGMTQIEGLHPVLATLSSFGLSMVLVLLIGESIPRAWAARNAETVLLRLLPFFHATSRILSPVVWLSGGIVGVVSDISGVRAPEESEEIVDEIRSAAMEGELEGVLQEDQKSMIESIIEFRSREVREVMTPRTKVAAIDASSDLETAVEQAIECGHSRFPVYEGDLDKVIGVLYAKDLLDSWGEDRANGRTVEDVMRTAYFVPETKNVYELLHELRARKIHIAIVLDEYGGHAGIVTIEDLIEEIIGDIEDEYDYVTSEPIRALGEREAEVDAEVRVDAVNEETGLSIPVGEDYDTIGGYLFAGFGRVPETGERIVLDETEFTVLQADERRIQRIHLRPSPAAEEEAGETEPPAPEAVGAESPEPGPDADAAGGE